MIEAYLWELFPRFFEQRREREVAAAHPLPSHFPKIAGFVAYSLCRLLECYRIH